MLRCSNTKHRTTAIVLSMTAAMMLSAGPSFGQAGGVLGKVRENTQRSVQQVEDTRAKQHEESMAADQPASQSTEDAKSLTSQAIDAADRAVEQASKPVEVEAGPEGATTLSGDIPEERIGTEIEEHLGAQLPMDARFVDEFGKEVRLGDLITGDKPVILNLGYYRCPMLCDLVQNGMVEAMKEMEWTVGDEYEVVSISIDPSETPTIAKAKQDNYIKSMGGDFKGLGWHFLTGKHDQIQRVSETVGFGYKWSETQKQYAHSAALILITPEGKVSRYLYGIQFLPQTLRLSLVEASEGKVGSTTDKVLLFCFQYDPDANSYAPHAMNLMRVGGVVTMLVVLAVLGRLWMRDATADNEPTPPSAAA